MYVAVKWYWMSFSDSRLQKTGQLRLRTRLRERASLCGCLNVHLALNLNMYLMASLTGVGCSQEKAAERIQSPSVWGAVLCYLTQWEVGALGWHWLVHQCERFGCHSNNYPCHMHVPQENWYHQWDIHGVIRYMNVHITWCASWLIPTLGWKYQSII